MDVYRVFVYLVLLYRHQTAGSFCVSTYPSNNLIVNVHHYSNVAESLFRHLIQGVHRNIVRGQSRIRETKGSNIESAATSASAGENRGRRLGLNTKNDDSSIEIDDIDYDDNDDNNKNIDRDDHDGDDVNARSMFGTKTYWDDVYTGRGDFPADTYSWYANWNELQHFVKPYAPTVWTSLAATSEQARPLRILIPGIGNDSLLVDMISAKYNQHHSLDVQDYSHHAMERQIQLLDSVGCQNYKYFSCDASKGDSQLETSSSIDSIPSPNTKQIGLHCCDITKKLPLSWYQSFDVIIEKGLLDAIYLSDDTNQNLQDATYNLHQILKTNGILISISSVIPNEVRHICFPSLNRNEHESCSNNNLQQSIWDWIRDGSTDAKKAGCFILRKIQ